MDVDVASDAFSTIYLLWAGCPESKCMWWQVQKWQQKRRKCEIQKLQISRIAKEDENKSARLEIFIKN